MHWYIFLMTFFVIFLTDYRKHKRAPLTEEWLNDNKRWHDLGHYFFQFWLYSVIPMKGIYALAGCFIVAIIIEICQISSIRDSDTWFDLFTHATGALTAFFLFKFYGL